MARSPGGEELLAYRNGRRWGDIRSDDINEYLKAAAGADFTAKDFRTWSATVLAAVALGAMPVPDTKTARKRRIDDAVKGVAAFLGNTPAVCRSSYIDPRVFDRYRGGGRSPPPCDAQDRSTRPSCHRPSAGSSAP